MNVTAVSLNAGMPTLELHWTTAANASQNTKRKSGNHRTR